MPAKHSAIVAHNTQFKESGKYPDWYNFNWNPNAKMPPGTDWDDTNRAPMSKFRRMILQASGLECMVAAATLDPSGVIPAGIEEAAVG